MFFHMSFFYLILLSEKTYKKRDKGLVLLADGTIFYGRSTGINGTSFGEICFNTGVTGYQEIFTCLLYTSPSPRDATLSRMPSSA